MKIVCAVIIVLLAMHLECGAFCLAESVGSIAHVMTGTAEPPPCHQHTDGPSNSHKPSHDTSNPCSQGPVIESKITATGKSASQLAAVLPVTVPVLTKDDPWVAGFVSEKPLAVFSPPITVSILRI